MMNPLEITLLFIILSALLGIVLKCRRRDRCLKSFRDDVITLQRKDGKTAWGRLRVESTGLELVYETKHADPEGHQEASYILYKHEFLHIQALVRYHDHLDEKARNQREKELKRTYHPGVVRTLARKTQNLFRMVWDGVVEVVNLFLSQAKKMSPAAGVLTSQDKYVNQMKQDLLGTVGTAFEPLLERYIGHSVVLEMVVGDQVIECPGVLKDYTAEFIELLDVDYLDTRTSGRRKADLVVPRQVALVRHYGE